MLDDPMTAARNLANRFTSIPGSAVDKLNDAVAVLDRAGDTATAGFIRSIVGSSGLDRTGLAAEGGEGGTLEKALAQLDVADPETATLLRDLVGAGPNAPQQRSASEEPVA